MLEDFFKLNEPIKEFSEQEEFIELLDHSKDLRNYLYRPDILSSNSEYTKYKISDTKFTNISFSKTTIKNIIFLDCVFTDCLFIGTKLMNCEFHNCKFLDSNPYKMDIENVYIDPEAFKYTIPNKSIDKANIAVYLFKQLYHNSIELGQSEFARRANYLFKKWDDRLLLFKYKKGIPYSVSHYQFWITYPINQFYKLAFGYGLRLRNFLISFIIAFVFFFSVNYKLWSKYGLQEKDVLIESFHPDSVNFAVNFLYTFDVTTKLIDSQIQPTSIIGMNLLAFQSFCAFILLTGLITILINKFVR